MKKISMTISIHHNQHLTLNLQPQHASDHVLFVFQKYVLQLFSAVFSYVLKSITAKSYIYTATV